MNIYPPAVPPTRECWFPVGSGTNAVTALGFIPGIVCANAQRARIAFHIPHDFATFVSAVVAIIPTFTHAGAVFALQANFGSVGQAYNVHTTGEGAVTFNVVNNEYFEADISNMLALVVAGDRGGVDFLTNAAGHSAFVMGVRLRYA